jgi:sugar phosphate isomerase/epimerase
MRRTTRREFLGQCMGATGGALLVPDLLQAVSGNPSVHFPSSPKERVAVASYPFREFIAGPDHKSGNPTVEFVDFAAHVVKKFGIHRIEPWSTHFPSIDGKYLERFHTTAEHAQVKVVDIAVDGEHSPYGSNREEREKAVAFSKTWIDVAAAIESPSVRTNIPAAKDTTPHLDPLAESLGRVAEYASKRNVVVHLENDNPVSEDPFFLAQVIERVNSAWLRALPDFGNSLGAHANDHEYAYRGIDHMFAHAYGICHVKNAVVNDRDQVVNVDLARTFSILKRHGYAGFCSIEYDIPGDPYTATAELIKKTVAYLS